LCSFGPNVRLTLNESRANDENRNVQFIKVKTCLQSQCNLFSLLMMY